MKILRIPVTMNDLHYAQFANAVARLIPRLQGQTVAVLGHIRPDGDCIGSQVALCRLLRSQGVDAVAVNQHAVPANLQTFVADTPFLGADDTQDLRESFRIAVDCSAHNRIGPAFMDRFPTVDFCVDHHVSNTGFATENCIDPHASATAEILTGIALDLQLPMDAITAQALYVGIATDTGQFRYAGTTERVFRFAAALVKAGANANAAAHELYEREREGRLRLLQHFLQTLQSHEDGRLMFGKISQSMFAQTGTHREDTEGFIDYARNIDSVKIAALLEEQKDGSVKGSLRSKSAAYKVDQLAARLNGGGHACAAGFHMPDAFDTFDNTFVQVVKEHLASLDLSEAPDA